MTTAAALAALCHISRLLLLLLQGAAGDAEMTNFLEDCLLLL
jgi:hypothetical protein